MTALIVDTISTANESLPGNSVEETETHEFRHLFTDLEATATATTITTTAAGGPNDEIDPRDLVSTSDYTLVPTQIESIINQHVTIRYFSDSSLSPIVFPTSSPPPPFAATSSSLSSSNASCQYWDVTLIMDMSQGCGGKIWPAAEILGSYIASHYGRSSSSSSSPWSGKSIVELGSGTGLLGFLVSKMNLNVSCIHITDQIAMLSLMKDNLTLNQSELKDPIYIHQLNWGQDLLSNTVPLHPDILLLADCVYLESAFQPLIDTMRLLATHRTEILFCYQKRRKADKRFFQLLKKHFTFQDVQDDDPQRTNLYRRQGTQLLRIYLK